MKSLLPIVLLFASVIGYGQISSDFIAPEVVCKNQNITLENSSENADFYEWDLCAMDMQHYKSQADVTTISALSSGFGYKMVQDQGKWFAFATSTNTHSIYRLEFGDRPTNVPVITNLGNVGGNLLFPEGVDVIKENNQWRIFVGSLESGYGITRIDLGNSLSNNLPSSVKLGTFGFVTRFRNVKCIRKGSNYYLMLPGYNTNSIIVIDYRDSFDNVIGPSDKYDSGVLSGLANPAGIDATFTGDGTLVVLASSYNGNSVTKLIYSPDIVSPPVVEATYSFDGVKKPYNVKILFEAGTYYAAVSNESVPVTIINFKDFNAANVPEELVYDEVFNYGGGVELFRFEGQSYLQYTGIYDSKLRAVTFEESCGASISFSKSLVPAIFNYTVSGEKQIELTVKSVDEDGVSVSHNLIIVSENTAPEVDFDFQGNCQGEEVSFQVVSNSSIETYHWEFGDNAFSDQDNVSHIYDDAGIYSVTLTLQESNSCTNAFSKEIKIYQPPLSDFSTPAQIICTGNEFTFNNLLHDVYDGLIAYNWFVNDELVSSEQHLKYTFTSTDNHIIRQVNTIPGCSYESTIVIENIGVGPTVEFTTDGHCEDDVITLVNQSEGEISHYQWSIGDGQQTTDVSPKFKLLNGYHSVTLRATGVNGCITTHTKEIFIYDNPDPDFKWVEEPICTNKTVSFLGESEQNDSPVISWLWDFDDENVATLQHPNQTFVDAGNYEVQLTVKSEAGCSGTIKKSVFVNSTPDSVFNYSTACENEPVQFTGPKDNEINSWHWQIGEKTYNGQDFTHTFRQPGEYNVKLVVTSVNGCSEESQQTVSVPQPITPNFVVEKNCVGQATQLTAQVHGSDSDPALHYQWTINEDEVLMGEKINYVFPETGEQVLQLNVVSQAGCSYYVVDDVVIVSAPEASFNVSQDIGVPSASIVFNNTSAGATSSEWSFGDGSVSHDNSPIHVFDQAGEFVTQLRAFNQQGCESFASKIIKISQPDPNVVIRAITTTDNSDGTLSVVITLENEGNTVFNSLPVHVDLSGKITLKETLENEFLPLMRYNLNLTYSISRNDLEFLCAYIPLDVDPNSESNKSCIQLSNETVVFTGYPNPTPNNYTLEWISAEEENLKISIHNTAGVIVMDESYKSKKGLNHLEFAISTLEMGIYYLSIRGTNTVLTQRILKSR